jgi:phosphohistidine phosphatase
MKTLLILRHAKSSWADESLPDHDRPLNKRGKRAAHRMGRLLEEEALWPDLILCSTAERAAATALLVTEAGGFGGDINYLRELYGAGPSDYIEAVSELGGAAGCVMVIGHNPGLAMLVQELTGEWHRMPTAALVAVTFEIDDWSDLESASGELAGVWRPKELP